MPATLELLARLDDEKPGFGFIIARDGGKSLIGFIWGGEFVTSPFKDEFGLSDVDPLTYYGLTRAQADAIHLANFGD